jgi:alkylated DNA repair dioxygenase AlkB
MDIDIYSNYLSNSEAFELYSKIIKNPHHFKHSPITKSGLPSKKRNKTIYGSIPKYIYEYYGKMVETPINPWHSFPELEILAKRIEKTTGQSYNTCVIQIYNSGDVEIKPHRDKEMKKDSIIASISLGETRKMRFERSGCETLDILLESGMLCLINPPTNDYWLHSIPTDTTKNPRISLVFRNF